MSGLAGCRGNPCPAPRVVGARAHCVGERVWEPRAEYPGAGEGAGVGGSVYSGGDQFWKQCARVQKRKTTLTGRLSSADQNALHVLTHLIVTST